MGARAESLLRRLRRRAAPPDGANDADAELLRRFVRARDEEAFTGLVRRHGALVRGVCRRVLGDDHDAEDAFQAVWLVFARKAGALHPARLAAWLHGVARQVALNARRANARRRRHEAQSPLAAPARRQPDPLAELSARELLAVLDEEVARLPEKYRLAVVLCCLEGLDQEEAAQRLGCTPGAVKGRLERGRRRLHRRLQKRGLALSAVLGVAEVARAAGGVPALPAATAGAATLFAAGQAAVGAVNVRAAALAEGVLRAMFLTKLKIAAVVLLMTAAVVGGAVGVLARQAKPPAAKPKADKDALQGAWTAVSAEEEGKKVPAKEVKARDAEWVFAGDRLTLPIKDEVKRVGYKLDPARKPKQIDLLLGKGKTAKGIYLLKGDTLTVCVQKEPGGERPAGFGSTAGTTHVLIVLKKKK
jgi:RNA polymerase sigma factor (sigma-70 family)